MRSLKKRGYFGCKEELKLQDSNTSGAMNLQLCQIPRALGFQGSTPLVVPFRRLVAEWIHFTLFGKILPTIKLKVYTFLGLMNSATRDGVSHSS